MLAGSFRNVDGPALRTGVGWGEWERKKGQGNVSNVKFFLPTCLRSSDLSLFAGTKLCTLPEGERCWASAAQKEEFRRQLQPSACCSHTRLPSLAGASDASRKVDHGQS